VEEVENICDLVPEVLGCGSYIEFVIPFGCEFKVEVEVEGHSGAHE